MTMLQGWHHKCGWCGKPTRVGQHDHPECEPTICMCEVRGPVDDDDVCVVCKRKVIDL